MAKKRKTIEEVFAGGVMAMMTHINAEKVAQLFTEEEANDFDAYFIANHAEREISYSLNYWAEKSQVDSYLSAMLTRFFPNWLKIKNALEAEYEIFDNSGKTRTISETREEKGTNEDSEKTQENANAFDGEGASDTQGSERSGNAVHDIATTLERTETTKGDDGNAKQYIVSAEVQLRNRFVFFENVANDIAQDACAVVY